MIPISEGKAVRENNLPILRQCSSKKYNSAGRVIREDEPFVFYYLLRVFFRTRSPGWVRFSVDREVSV